MHKPQRKRNCSLVQKLKGHNSTDQEPKYQRSDHHKDPSLKETNALLPTPRTHKSLSSVWIAVSIIRVEMLQKHSRSSYDKDVTVWAAQVTKSNEYEWDFSCDIWAGTFGKRLPKSCNKILSGSISTTSVRLRTVKQPLLHGGGGSISCVCFSNSSNPTCIKWLTSISILCSNNRPWLSESLGRGWPIKLHTFCLLQK